jgi:hypothetical protein
MAVSACGVGGALILGMTQVGAAISPGQLDEADHVCVFLKGRDDKYSVTLPFIKESFEVMLEQRQDILASCCSQNAIQCVRVSCSSLELRLAIRFHGHNTGSNPVRNAEIPKHLLETLVSISVHLSPISYRIVRRIVSMYCGVS